MLGGTEIEHPQGLVGHSDGDVLTHALIDAVLGAAGLGDIGTHFPSDDPRYEGASSLGLLAAVRRLVERAGLMVASTDATVVAQAPRLSPHVAAMRSRIAETLGVPATSVSVKATTNDGIGVVGAGGAIAAFATAVLVERT